MLIKGCLKLDTRVTVQELVVEGLELVCEAVVPRIETGMVFSASYLVPGGESYAIILYSLHFY